jgi:hypothetical protein
MLLTGKTYNKICLFCRNEFEAQKRTTKYCSHQCNSRAYKVQKRNEKDVDVNFEEFVKRELQLHRELMSQIQVTLSELINTQKIASREFITPDEYCKLKGISRKTLSRYIQDNKVIVSKISNRKFLIKKDFL